MPSPAGFKIMSSMHALQTTSKKQKWNNKKQNTLNSFCDGQENAQNCFPYKNENEETTCTEKDPLAVQVEQPKYLET